MENNEDNIPEKPSTNNKKAQGVVLLVVFAMLILVFINAIMKAGGGKDLDDKADKRTLIQTQKSPASLTADFDGKFRSASADNVADVPKKVGESYDEMMARIRREEAEKNKAKSDKLIADKYALNKISAPELTFEEKWIQKENERALESRYDEFTLDLGTKVSVSAVTSISTETKEEKTKRVLSQISKSRALMERVKAGDYSGLGLSNNVNTDSELPMVAGQSISKSPQQLPLAGQKLLPVTTVIRTAFDQSIMSDYIGLFRMRITQDVYDVTNSYILIPQGSTALCQSSIITNINAPIQARMGYLIKDVVLPDGRRIDFSSQAGVDKEGIAAVKGEVNRHLFAQMMGVAAYALVGSSSSRNGSTDNSNGSYAGEVGTGARDIGSRIAEKYLSLTPTIHLPTGTPARIIVAEEVYITPWSRLSDEYVY